MRVLCLALVVIIQCNSISGSRSINYGDDNSPENASTEDSSITSSFVLPKQIFNDGKPFYLEKDPVSGNLDFSLKKSAPLVSTGNELNPQTDKDISLNTNSIKAQNFHDFLNLPIKYSSSKFVYPLVSSSYANLKYQGNNKNYLSNHKNYTSSTTSTATPPKYYTSTREEIKEQTTKKITTSTSVQPSTPSPSTTYRRPPSTQSSTRPTISSRYTTREYSKYSPTRGRPTQSTTHVPSSNPSLPYSSTTRRYQTIPNRGVIPLEKNPSFGRFTTESSRATPSIQSSTTVNSTRYSSSEFEPMTPPQNYVTREPADVYTSMMKKNKTESDDMNLSDLFNSLFEDEDADYDSTTTIKPSEATSRPTSPLPAVERNETMQSVVTKQTRPTYQMTSSTSLAPSPTPSSSSSPSVSRPHSPSSPFPTSSTSLSPTTAGFQPPKQSNTQDFVKFDMQPPGVLQFKPVSSMNNIVISPDQNSAAFVLGSQQAVGSSENLRPYDASHTNEKNNNAVHPVKFSNKDQYDIDPFSHIGYSTMKPQGFAHASTTEQSTTVGLNNVKLGPSGVAGSVRFPADNYENAPIVTGTFKTDQKPVIADSLALPQQGIQNQVMFPSVQQTPLGPNQIRENNVFSSYQVGNNQPQPPHQHSQSPTDQFNLVSFESDRLNQQQPGSSQQGPQQQGPPQQVQHQPAPHHQNHLHQGALQHGPLQHPQTQQQNLIAGNNIQPVVRLPDITNDLNPPLQEPVKHNQFRPDQNRHDLVYNNFPRPGMPNPHQRPTNDRTLPNILPQFRPNSQMFHGHKEGGPFRMSPHSRPPFIQTPNGMRYRPPVHFRQNYPTKSGVTTIDPNIGNQIDNNRRYFQVRPAQQFTEKIFDRSLPPPQPYQRPANDRYPSAPQPGPIAEKELTERKYTVVNDIEKNPPRRSIGPNDFGAQDEKVLRIEPVVTLQMIQQQKLHNKHVQSSVPQPAKEALDEHPLGLPPNKNTPPVYVVYPMQKNAALQKHESVVGTDEKETIVVGTRGGQKPFSPPELNSGSEYQNTPFTVIRQEQKPILGAKPKASPYQKQVFPYSLERVKENYQNGLYNLGEEPTDAIPRVINKGPSIYADVYTDEKISGTNRETDRPIAIAYTPTEPSAPHKPLNHDNGDVDEFGNPSHGDHYGQNFDAPFFPSVNLEAVQSTNNGWAVVTPATVPVNSQKIEKRNDVISPSLMNAHNHKKETAVAPSFDQIEDGESVEVITQKFDMDSFQPELHSGFKPIYPSEGAQKPTIPKLMEKASPAKKDDSIEALIYEDSDGESAENDTENNEMTTSS